MNTSESNYLAFVPISRVRGAVRGLLWFGPGALLMLAAAIALQGIWGGVRGMSSPLVNASLTLAVLPILLGGLVCIWHGSRWIGLALWPWKIGFFAHARLFEMCLGPFGVRSFPVSELTIKYLFELDDDELSDGGFEAYLPEEVQISRFLPRMSHPSSPRGLNEIILRFADGSEEDIAKRLRPAIKAWRNEQ